jgi:hypothetical protein
MGITVKLTEEEEKECLVGLASILKHKNTSTAKELLELDDLSNLTTSQKLSLICDTNFVKEIVKGDNPRNFTLAKDEISTLYMKEIPLAFYVNLGFTFVDMIDCLFKLRTVSFLKSFMEDMMKLILETYEEKDSDKLCTFATELSRYIYEHNPIWIVSFLLELDEKYDIFRNKKLLDLILEYNFYESKDLMNHITTKYEDECDMGKILSICFINGCDLDLAETLLEKGHLPNNTENFLQEDNFDLDILRKVLDLYYKYIDPDVIHSDLYGMMSGGKTWIEINTFLIILDYMGRYHDVGDLIKELVKGFH